MLVGLSFLLSGCSTENLQGDLIRKRFLTETDLNLVSGLGNDFRWWLATQTVFILFKRFLALFKTILHLSGLIIVLKIFNKIIALMDKSSIFFILENKAFFFKNRMEQVKMLTVLL